MSDYFSQKALTISASPTLAIDEKYKAMLADGIDVIGFGTGEPDFDTPQYIKDAAIKAINDGFTKYTPAAGTMSLRKAICRKFERDNSLSYAPNQIVVSNGAKHSLVNAFLAILNPGDEVIIPSPYWVSYPEMVKIADGIPVSVHGSEENDFKVTVEQLESVTSEYTRALVLNSPSNPTGMIYTKEELEKIADYAVKHDIYVISDEVYEKLIYDGEKHYSIASLNEKIKDLTIVVNAVSKTYAMTGWRIGYTASNPKIAKIMSNIQSHATSNPNSIAQAAAEAALNGGEEEIEKMRLEFLKRRDYMVEKMNLIDGISCKMPNGAFYVMMNISKIKGKTLYGKKIETSDDFCELLLEKGKVALVPGSGFEADDYIRWSYAASMDKIVKGLERLEKFVKEEY